MPKFQLIKAVLNLADATLPYSLSQRPIQAVSGCEARDGFKALVIMQNLSSAVFQLNRN
jgi:hypothetical protein